MFYCSKRTIEVCCCQSLLKKQINSSFCAQFLSDRRMYTDVSLFMMNQFNFYLIHSLKVSSLLMQCLCCMRVEQV